MAVAHDANMFTHQNSAVDPKCASRGWDKPDKALRQLIRQKVKHYTDKHLYSTALFWIDKLANISSYENVGDFYEKCNRLFLNKEYARCRSLIESRTLQKTSGQFQYLLAECYFAMGEFGDALTILEARSPRLRTKRTNEPDSNASTRSAVGMRREDSGHPEESDDIFMTSADVSHVSMDEDRIASPDDASTVMSFSFGAENFH